MLNLKFQNIQRQSAWAPGNTSSSLPKRDFLDALSKSLPRCDILWHFWKRWGQNQCQTPTTSPWPNYPSKKIIDMSDVLFDSFYDSELPNAKGCAQWKIELQLFGKGGSVIVSSVDQWLRMIHYWRCCGIQDSKSSCFNSSSTLDILQLCKFARFIPSSGQCFCRANWLLCNELDFHVSLLLFPSIAVLA